MLRVRVSKEVWGFRVRCEVWDFRVRCEVWDFRVSFKIRVRVNKGVVGFNTVLSCFLCTLIEVYIYRQKAP